MNLVTLNKVKFDWLRYLSRKARGGGGGWGRGGKEI